MFPISVYVNRQLDGITYSLSPLSRKNFYEKFPDAHPSGSVFVNYDSKAGFETYHNRVERFVLPILLGLDDDTIKKVGPVEFVDARTNDLVYRYGNE